MHIEETKRVIAKIALIDNRTADLAVLQAWHEVIGHLDYPDALRAVTLHFQRSAEYLKPKHIIDLAREARREREVDEARASALRAIEPPPPQGMPQWFRDYLDTMGKEKPAREAVPTGAASDVKEHS